MQLFKTFLIVLWAVNLPACNNSSFSGSGKSNEQVHKKPAADAKPSKNNQSKAEPLGDETPGTENEPLDDDVKTPQTDKTDLGTDVVNATPPVTVPDDVVEGQEVLKSCEKCLARAKTLSSTIGFTASMSKTYNMGFYKIAPAQNLCDIHFMNDMNTQIDDHAGNDSVGNNQVILYCPCDCKWASTTPPGGNLFP